ncbi:MAG: hypothetical protein K8R77_10040 [Anaerolineaceae bacterium]|nr:hypothetical protein [Anaerolineaceae bacterium]
MEKSKQTINREEGTTDAERFLKNLCDHTFLSLWSYSNIYRDQGKTEQNAQGKEICDLIVVFENHIILFSDKDCKFPETGNLEVDWTRWYKKAIERSAKQIWGAERWIKEFPERLFLDRACTQPFPLEIPDPGQVKFHRIVVAHAVSERCKAFFGGSGSLMITPSIKDAEHKLKFFKGGQPFTIGQISSKKGYAHVLDDTSLKVVLKTLDTVTDFVNYLSKKEKFITSGKLISAAGEDDLLAFYFEKLDENGEHDFIIPPDIDGIAIDEGFWDHFVNSPERKVQIEADEISYSWDGLIETFSKHILENTQYYTTSSEIKDSEKSIRFLAREPRTRRRLLAKSLLEMIGKSKKNQKLTRVMLPSRAGDPYYVFLLLPHLVGIPISEYREVRRKLLEAYCLVTRHIYPDAKDIVGIATESGRGVYGSEDALYFDGRNWNDESRREAERLQEDLGLLVDTKIFKDKEKEFPI